MIKKDEPRDRWEFGATEKDRVETGSGKMK